MAAEIKASISELTDKERETLKAARAFWQEVADKHHWNIKEVCVQVWLREDGSMGDSVSFLTLEEDIIIRANGDVLYLGAKQ